MTVSQKLNQRRRYSAMKLRKNHELYNVDEEVIDEQIKKGTESEHTQIEFEIFS